MMWGSLTWSSVIGVKSHMHLSPSDECFACRITFVSRKYWYSCFGSDKYEALKSGVFLVMTNFGIDWKVSCV